MGFDFDRFEDEGLSEAFVEWLVDEQWLDIRGHFERLWEYYHNPMYQIGQTRGVCQRLRIAGTMRLSGIAAKWRETYASGPKDPQRTPTSKSDSVIGTSSSSLYTALLIAEITLSFFSSLQLSNNCPI